MSEAHPSQLPPPVSLTPNATPSTPTQRTFMNPMRGWMATPSGAFNGFRGLASRAVRAFTPTFTPSRKIGVLQPTGPVDSATIMVAEQAHGPAVSQAVVANGVSDPRAFGVRPKTLSFASQPVIIAQPTSLPTFMRAAAETMVTTTDLTLQPRLFDTRPVSYSTSITHPLVPATTSSRPIYSTASYAGTTIARVPQPRFSTAVSFTPPPLNPRATPFIAPTITTSATRSSGTIPPSPLFQPTPVPMHMAVDNSSSMDHQGSGVAGDDFYSAEGWILNLDQRRGSTHHQLASRIPKRELPKFDGDPLNWPMFIQSFGEHVDRKCADDSDRQDILKSCLPVSIQKELGKSLQHPGLYQQALQELYEKFGNPRIVVAACTRSISKLKPYNDGDFKGLIHFSACLRSTVGTLQVNGYYYEICSSGMLAQAVEKLPPTIQNKWADFSYAIKDHFPNLADLSDWLNDSVNAKCCVRAGTDDTTTKATASQFEKDDKGKRRPVKSFAQTTPDQPKRQSVLVNNAAVATTFETATCFRIWSLSNAGKL